MARVLVCWELGNGLAYIQGITAIGHAIRKSGHEVIFAVRDLSHADRLLGKHFKYYQAPTTVIPPSQVLQNPMTFADVLINLGYGNPAAVTARVRAWRNLIDLVKPDIVRCAHAPGALLAARGTGIRSLVVGIGFLVPPAVSPLPMLRSWAKDAKPENMAARERQVLDGMNAGLEAISAPRVASIGALYGETDIRVLYTYPELDDYGPRDDVKYLGNFQPGMGAAPEWPQVTGKRIFAYLDPVKHIDLLLKALAASGQPVLAFLPRAPEELLKQYAVGNLRIAQQPLDVVKTAAACDIGVSHGGHNIAGTFLAAGKPQLMVPNFFPERVTAEKIVALQAGLRSDWDEAEISMSLARLMHEAAFAEQARACATKVAHLSMEAAMKGAVADIDTLATLGPRRAESRRRRSVAAALVLIALVLAALLFVLALAAIILGGGLGRRLRSRLALRFLLVLLLASLALLLPAFPRRQLLSLGRRLPRSGGFSGVRRRALFLLPLFATLLPLLLARSLTGRLLTGALLILALLTPFRRCLGLGFPGGFRRSATRFRLHRLLTPVLQDRLAALLALLMYLVTVLLGAGLELVRQVHVAQRLGRRRQCQGTLFAALHVA